MASHLIPSLTQTSSQMTEPPLQPGTISDFTMHSAEDQTLMFEDDVSEDEVDVCDDEVDVCDESHAWVPQVNDDVKPKVGMSFNSLAEGKEFYHAYAKESGFGVRSSTTTYHKKTKEMTSKTLLYWKEGFLVSRGKNIDFSRQRKMRVLREGCKALIRIKRKIIDNIEKWVVVKFIEKHNHPLTSPNKTHLIPSHRKLTPVKKALFTQYRKANIGTSKIIEVFGIQAGGYDKIGCTERDIRNYERDNKMEEREFDAQNLLNHLRSEQEIDPSFYFAFEVDNEKKLTNLFWADGLARKAYSHFGDVLVFDTTYQTNQYSMVLALFTGVNHHGQSIIFGCGLLKDEKTTSFIWLFEKFLNAMSEKDPVTIITDQDPAMRAAIERTLPRSYHRFCMWHIMKKMSKKLGATFHQNGFSRNFKSCIYGSDTAEEFESRWVMMLDSYQLYENDWLSSLYVIRDKWIPAYSKDVFLAGMRTTQRSESMDAFFDDYVSKKNSLVEFYSHFVMGVKKQRYRQLEADNQSMHSRPQLKTRFLLEKQMGDIYTSEIFNIFQDELVASMECGSHDFAAEGHLPTFAVRKNGEDRVRYVTFDETQHKAWCDCLMFESEGVPCSHILVVLRNMFYDKLPPFFILNGWTKTATSTAVFDSNGYELGGGGYNATLTTTASEIDARWHGCRSKAYQSEEAKAIVQKYLTCMEEDLQRLTIVVGDEHNKDTNITSNDMQSFIRPPNISKTKGSGKRIKGGKEIAMEQASKNQRLCNGCGKRGVDHDKRNCPMIKERIVAEEYTIFESQASVQQIEHIRELQEGGTY